MFLKQKKKYDYYFHLGNLVNNCETTFLVASIQSSTWLLMLKLYDPIQNAFETFSRLRHFVVQVTLDYVKILKSVKIVSGLKQIVQTEEVSRVKKCNI